MIHSGVASGKRQNICSQCSDYYGQVVYPYLLTLRAAVKGSRRSQIGTILRRSMHDQAKLKFPPLISSHFRAEKRMNSIFFAIQKILPFSVPCIITSRDPTFLSLNSPFQRSKHPIYKEGTERKFCRLLPDILTLGPHVSPFLHFEHISTICVIAFSTFERQQFFATWLPK